MIAYAICSLKPAEIFPAYKLDFLEMKRSVSEKVHDYLYGTKFKSITDNNLLIFSCQPNWTELVREG